MNRHVIASLLAALVLAVVVGSTPIDRAEAQASYVRISGEGSSWSANAVDAMRVNVRQFGITVDYNPSGSSAGRKNFLNGTVDFAASDIPFQFDPEDGSPPENPAPGSYAYIPVTAGGTAFMYNLVINGQRVTNLRLSGENISKIFTGVIKQWNDPALAADNPGLTLPARAIVPVVRSDGSGSSAQFTLWMIAKHKPIWDAYCQASGRAPRCGSTSFYPTPPGGQSQSGDVGVAGYVSQGFAEGAIGYVNYSYALNVQFPVVKVLNAAGYYTEPTPENVAVSLLQAKINTDEANPATFLTQDLSGVYNDADPRNYQLSSYSYFILPTKVGGQFTAEKGRTLSAFANYAMCQAQQDSASLGYSPLPVNLVTASLEQIKLIPGAEVANIDATKCNNPTFSASGENVLAANAPRPAECDRQGPAQCATGTGGVKSINTPTAPPVPGGGGVAPGGGSAAPAPGAGAAPTAGAPGAGTPAPGAGGTGGAAGTAGTSGTGGTGGTSGTGGTGGTGGAGTTDPTGSVTDAGSTDAAAVVDPDTGLAVEPTCDPDTGICGPDLAAQQSGTQTATGAAQVGAIVPSTLDQESGWGSKQILTVLIILFTLGLVFVPAYMWRRMSNTNVATQGAEVQQIQPAERMSV